MTKHVFTTSRRRFLGGTAATASTLALGSYLKRAHAASPLRISAYGGYFEDSLAEFVYPDFSAETGIPTESISQTGGFSWMTMLETSAKAGNPATDVTMTGGAGPRRAPQVFQALEVHRAHAFLEAVQ